MIGLVTCLVIHRSTAATACTVASRLTPNATAPVMMSNVLIDPINAYDNARTLRWVRKARASAMLKSMAFHWWCPLFSSDKPVRRGPVPHGRGH